MIYLTTWSLVRRQQPKGTLPRRLGLNADPLRKHQHQFQHHHQRRKYMDVNTRPSHSRMFNREPVPVKPPPPPKLPPNNSDSDTDAAFYGILFCRAAAAAAAVYCLTEYVADITLTEGPSMTPTIQSSGEIIVVDKFMTRGGRGRTGSDRCGSLELTADKRVKQAVERQREFEQSSDDESKHNQEDVCVWHVPYMWHERYTYVSVTDLPRPSWRQWLTQVTSPLAVGDVVVVQHPHRRGTVCKRVLGLPGDQILLYRAQNQRFSSNNRFSNSQLLTVPDGHVWLEGDNPNNSADSRSYGPVPAALIQGRVLCRIWPLRGQAAMVRGARPRHLYSRSEPCTGSTVLPAGYQGQQIVKHYYSPQEHQQRLEQQQQAKNSKSSGSGIGEREKE
jgi:signal peptidase I